MTEEQNKLAEEIEAMRPRYVDAAVNNRVEYSAADIDALLARAAAALRREPATDAVLEALKAARSWLESDEGEGRTFAEMIEIEDRSLASSGKHAWNRDFISMVRKVEAALKGKGASQGVSRARRLR